MKNLDKIWNEIERYPEPSENDQKVIEVFKTLIFSPYEKFHEIRKFVEEIDRETLERAMWEIQNIPSMEAGDDDEYNEDIDRYHLYGNVFRECHLSFEFQRDIWLSAKPKNKKRFF
jgi:hypothetical protein